MNDHSTTVSVPYLVEAVAFLLTVVIVVPLCRRFNISPILGYLVIGAAIGPYSLGIVADADGVRHFAELGVILLLFTIGLELSFERLRAFTRMIFGLGLLQVVISAAVIGGIAYAWGNSPEAAAVVGLCLALSSTAMVMQLLQERGESATNHGRASFAVLLFQDLAVVPILILVSVLGAGEDSNLWLSVGTALGKAVLAVVLIVLLGRYLLRYLFRVVAQTGSVDVFTAMMLLAILATSLATGFSGLSMALGAFLAGLLLAETEFRHQIESEIAPFKGLFLGLFFMSVGMSVNLTVALDRSLWVGLSVVGLIAIKAAIIFPLALAFGVNRIAALRAALLLGEAGEFAFVVIGAATLGYALIPSDVAQFMVMVAGLSMALTPLLAWLGGELARRLESVAGDDIAALDGEALHDHVVIAGYGRVGRAVASVLRSEGIPYVALDTNIQRVRNLRQNDEPVYYGQADRPEMLERVGAERASVMLLTMDDPPAAGRAVQIARRRWPELRIVVRARDAEHAAALQNLGADAVVPETFEASLQIAGHVLRGIGVRPDAVDSCLNAIRDEAYSELRQAAASSTGP